MQLPGERRKFVGLVEHVVDVFDEDILEGQHPVARVDVIIARFEQFGERMFFAHRHDLTAHRISRAVQ